MDLELAAVARARVHVPDRERAAEMLEDHFAQPLLERSQRGVRKRGGLGDDAGFYDLLQDLIHGGFSRKFAVRRRLFLRRSAS